MNEKRDLDLTRYATPKLRELASQIERRILELQAAAIEDARARASAIADSVGVPLEEILRAAAPIRKGRVGRALRQSGQLSIPFNNATEQLRARPDSADHNKLSCWIRTAIH